jgi:hypothetical protein
MPPLSDFSMRPAVVMGAGMVSCGEWLLRSAENQSGNGRDICSAYQAKAWIDGFLSGLNIASPAGSPDFLRSKPNDSALTAWMDNYCKSNPLCGCSIGLRRRREYKGRQSTWRRRWGGIPPFDWSTEAGMEIPPRAHPHPQKIRPGRWHSRKNFLDGQSSAASYIRQKFWHSHDAGRAAGPAMSAMPR